MKIYMKPVLLSLKSLNKFKTNTELYLQVAIHHE